VTIDPSKPLATAIATAMTVQVMVPANGLGAIDDGPHYTVTSACP